MFTFLKSFFNKPKKADKTVSTTTTHVAQPSFEEWANEFNVSKGYSVNPPRHYDTLEEAKLEDKINLIKKLQSNVHNDYSN